MLDHIGSRARPNAPLGTAARVRGARSPCQLVATRKRRPGRGRKLLSTLRATGDPRRPRDELHVEGEVASLVIDERLALGAARELVILALVVSLPRIAASLCGTRAAEGSEDVAFPQPKGWQRFEPSVRQHIRFEQPVNQLVFPANVLHRPIVQADSMASRLAQEQCEKELAALHRPRQEMILERVRSLIAGGDGDFRSLAEVVMLLGMSERTLKRRLSEFGVSFSTLFEEQQRERAFALLREGTLSVEQVASRLGYSDAANFTRAFRRWTGTTPLLIAGSTRSTAHRVLLVIARRQTAPALTRPAPAHHEPTVPLGCEIAHRGPLALSLGVYPE